jgi:hypothetical protein
VNNRAAFGQARGRCFYVPNSVQRIYASEKGGTIIPIKLKDLANLWVKSGEFMLFTTNA